MLRSQKLVRGRSGPPVQFRLVKKIALAKGCRAACLEYLGWNDSTVCQTAIVGSKYIQCIQQQKAVARQLHINAMSVKNSVIDVGCFIILTLCENALDYLGAGCVNVIEYPNRAFMMFEETEECGVAVLSGRGGHFCAGYDLKELAGTSVASILGKYELGPAPMV